MLLDTVRGRFPALPPVSSPSIEHDVNLDGASSQSHPHNTASPPITRLPPPQTPSSARDKYRDGRSEHYAAPWGYPHEFSPPSRASRTAALEQISNEELESSPLPNFGLEDLVPSRLGVLRLPQAVRDPLEKPTVDVESENENNELTPRSGSKRWVQLPKRSEAEASQKIRWWSDESAQSGSDQSQQRARPSSPTTQSQQSRRAKPFQGHKSRTSNQTINQQSYLTGLREKKGEMSSLMNSRWAADPASPPQEPDTTLSGSRRALQSMAESGGKEKGPGLFASRWADTPPPDDLDQKEDEGGERSDHGMTTSNWPTSTKSKSVTDPAATNWRTEESVHEKPELGAASDDFDLDHAVKENLQKEVSEAQAKDSAHDDTTSKADIATTPLSPKKVRMGVSRVKRKVVWRNKTCVILIPRLDFSTMDLAIPLSTSEVEARVKGFEEEGYKTSGFDLSHDSDPDLNVNHVKPIYPEEAKTRDHDSAHVRLPNLNRWKAYTDSLIEQKLAALGVSIGNEEPATASTQDMSRQSSSQYSGIPFSPPIPAGSANSFGRPGMIRGHSHTMSVASPISPLNGPFGHMHRHSTVTGPLTLQQLHFSNQGSAMNGMRTFSPLGQAPAQQFPFPPAQSFSPQHQFALPGFNRTGSPAQVAALRSDLGGVRGPGSPLGQQMLGQPPQGYSKGFAGDQLQRQHSNPIHAPQTSVPNAYAAQSVSNAQPDHSLPQLPEAHDEEELVEQAPTRDKRGSELESESALEAEPETPTYMAPHKRAQLNANIAVPTPRGHRHNISEGLERDILEAEQRRNDERQNWIEVEEEVSAEQSSKSEGKWSSAETSSGAEKDPLSMDYNVRETPHAHKKTASRLNVAAPSFRFNPGASAQPAPATFTFGERPDPQPSVRHSRQQSSGAFNAAAPVFKPAGMPSLSKSEFSFSSSGATFKPNAPSFEPKARGATDATPAIFGKVDIPEIVKPARRSKALPIMRPEESLSKSIGSGAEYEDEEGRIAQGNERLKRQRKVGGDDDEVPQFAEPSSPLPFELMQNSPAEDVDAGSNSASNDHREDISAVNDVGESEKEVDNTVEHTPQQMFSRPVEPGLKIGYRKHKASSSLFALATPFAPVFPSEVQTNSVHQHGSSVASISDLEEGELRKDEPPSDSTGRAREPSFSPIREAHSATAMPSELDEGYMEPARARVDNVTLSEPSFDEIDAVMRRLNEAEGEQDVEASPEISPLPSPGAQPMQGVTYLPEWTRSDAPSPSPKRQLPRFHAQPDSSFKIHERTDSGERAMNDFANVDRLNKSEDIPVSDWSGEFSGPDEEKLVQRGHFFDSHIDNLVGRAVDSRLQPLEESLRSIEHAVNRRPVSSERIQKRSSSAIESDADDEDEQSEAQRQRPISRGRDKRVDQMKAAVLEALREQSPRRRSQSSRDIQELHSVLADMKMSFARAASEGLELQDVRAVVEDVVSKQGQAVVPFTADDGERYSGHKREISGIERRLNETLAGALEEANQRRAAEEREVDTRRMLRLAEEELELFCESSRNHDVRISAAEREREELLRRLESAEQAQSDAEEQVHNLEAENAATYATLEEYRMSSKKWRQDIDQSTREREDIEKVVTDLEHQLEESEESGGGLRRRLENLHSDMATACGQLASEKAEWKDKQDEYRSKCEYLESELSVHSMKRAELEEELRHLRAGAQDTHEAKSVLDQMKSSNTSLEEMVHRLQAELADQQSRATRFERDFQDSQEAGRSEVERTRVSMETDIEAANHQVNLVRAGLEADLSQVRSELENVRIEAETATARHEHLLEEEDNTRRETLRKVNHASSVALDEARQKHQSSTQELQAAHKRALEHAIEDKGRSEMFLNERLSLSDAKLQHFQERVLHLEERLEIAKSAAQAAAISAQLKAVTPASRVSATLPEKVSPQALRESIVVLQEQLQDRETQIEKLQSQADAEGSAKSNKQDEEIAWLRELLAVRGEELTDLVNTLARPTFDRRAIRDAAIRIRANLQMEQQEKERSGEDPQTFPGQAIASFSNFATPKAAQLSSAFTKWRSNMESSALRNARQSSDRPRSFTPSKPTSSPAFPDYMHGLMTPPASNLRNTPSPEAAASLPPPRLHSRPTSKSKNAPFSEPPKTKSRQHSIASDAPTTPLFRSQSYDQDAEDRNVHMETFEEESVEDEDLDFADNRPPAFRSLEEELDDSNEDDLMA